MLVLPSDRSTRLRPSWSTPEQESRHRAPERSVGSLAALMEHAETGIPGTEPPSDRSARLWPAWSMPERGFLASSPRAIGQLACGPHGARWKGDSWRRAPERSIGSLMALMEHAGTGITGVEPP